MNHTHTSATPFSWLPELLLALLIGASGAFIAGYLLSLNQPPDLVHYRLNGLSLPVPALLRGLPAAGALLLPAIAWRCGDFRLTLSRLNRMLFPLLLPLPVIPAAPDSYWTVLFTAAAAGVAFYRAGAVFSAEFLLKRHSGAFRRAAPYLTAALFLIAVLWGYYLQRRAYDSMFLYFSDWGEYAENYLRLAFAENRSFADFLAVAGHWNPAVNLLMSAALHIYPQADTIFLINAAAIGSAAPLSYALARSLKLPAALSLSWAAIALLNPVIANQPLALFYGFHPINFMIPAVLGFFICRARKQRGGMAALFLLSLLIQETVAVFWAGYAVYLLLKRRYAAGIGLFLFCVMFFWLLSTVVMPHLFAHGSYTQMFHYGNLGATPSEVLLSPFLRPAAFWRTVFQWQNFAFAAGLLAPVWLPVLIRPRLAAAALPLLAGVCLQGSPELKNLVMQYGVEITTLLLAAAILNTAAVYHGTPAPLLNLPGRGIAAARHRTARAGGLTLAALLAGTILYFLFGQYPWQRIRNLPDGTNVLRHLFSRLPEESGRIIATQRLRAHALFERPTASLNAAPQSGDIVMLDLHDPSSSAGALEKMRAELARRHTRPVAWANWFGSQLVCFEVDPATPPPGAPPFLRQMEDGEFRSFGQPLSCGNPDFELRLQGEPGGKAVLLVRLRNRVAYDIDLDIRTRRGNKASRHTIPFAHGLFPAYTQPEHQVFLLELPGGFPEQIAVELIRRPESGPASTPR